MSGIRTESAGGRRTGVAERAPTPSGRGEFVVRDVHPSDRPAVLTLVTRVWDESRRRDTDFFWDWRHALDATTTHPGHVAQVLERDGRILAYAGNLPAHFLLDGERVEGAYCCDLVAAPEERGAGLRLMKHLLGTCAFLFGSSNERTRTLWERLIGRDSVTVREARKQALVLDPAPALLARGAPAPVILAARAANAVARALFRLAASVPTPGVTLEDASCFPAEIDALCAAFARGYRFQVARDRAYLDWRFTACPLRYRIVLLREAGRLQGYMVCRPGLLNGRRVMILVEMLAVGRVSRNYRAMLRRLVAEARSAGVCEIQTIDTGDERLLRALRRAGFIPRPDRLSITAYAGPERAAPEGLYEPGGWYVGLGDSEFEFTFFRQGADARIDAGAAAEKAGDRE